MLNFVSSVFLRYLVIHYSSSNTHKVAFWFLTWANGLLKADIWHNLWHTTLFSKWKKPFSFSDNGNISNTTHLWTMLLTLWQRKRTISPKKCSTRAENFNNRILTSFATLPYILIGTSIIVNMFTTFGNFDNSLVKVQNVHI